MHFDQHLKMTGPSDLSSRPDFSLATTVKYINTSVVLKRCKNSRDLTAPYALVVLGRTVTFRPPP